MLLYGSEYWTLTKEQMIRIEKSEICFFRPMAGHTMTDHKLNDDISGELGITRSRDSPVA
jgi:hypothetical protein